MKVAAALAVVVALVVAGALAFVYSGAYDVAATTPHSTMTRNVMRTVLERSVKRQAREIKVPELDDPEKVHRGFKGFHEMCVTCHGAPGAKPSEIAAGLNPKPPDLAEAATAWTPAELYVITKHGIKMTGMPAWGPTHEEEALWALVAFLKVLPAMPAGEYQEAVEYHKTNTASETLAKASGHH